MADHRDRAAADPAEARDDRAIIAEAAVAVKLDEALDEGLDVVEGVGAVGVPGKLHPVPGFGLLALLALMGLRAEGAVLRVHGLSARVWGDGAPCDDGGKRLPHVLARDDQVDHAVLALVLGGLHALADRHPGDIDDTRAREAHRGAGFGDDDVAEEGVARHDAAVGGVGEDADVGHSGLSELPAGARGLGHLHQRDEALLHPGAAGGADDDQGQALLGRALDQPRDALADHPAHRAAAEAGLHHADRDVHARKLRLASDHRILHPGLALGVLELAAVVRERERVAEREVGVPLLEGVAIHRHLKPLTGVQPEVEAALAAHPQVLLELLRVEELMALRALLPHIRRDVIVVPAADPVVAHLGQSCTSATSTPWLGW